MSVVTGLITLAALLCAGTALATTRSWRAAVRVLLDLLLAASLLRLAAIQSWSGILAAALVVVVRHLVSTAIFHGGGNPGGPVRAVRPPGRTR